MNDELTKQEKEYLFDILMAIRLEKAYNNKKREINIIDDIIEKLNLDVIE